MDEEVMERHLRQVLPELLKCLRVDPLLMEHLHAARVLDLHYWHTIEAESNIVNVEMLIDHIRRNPRTRFKPFIQALKKTHQHEAVRLLTLPEVFTKIDDIEGRDDAINRTGKQTGKPHYFQTQPGPSGTMDEKAIHHHIDHVLPELLEYLEVSELLIAHLLRRGVIYRKLDKFTPPDGLITHIRQDVQTRLEPFIEALKETGQYEAASLLTLPEGLDKLDVLKGQDYAFPEITYHESLNQAVVVEIGGEVQLEAAIHGGPETVVKWYHLEKEIHPNEDLTITSTEEKTLLSITSCTKAHDGEYALKARNSRGFFHSFFKISVFTVRPRDMHIKPPPPDIFGAKLSSEHSLILKHPSSDITLTIPKGAVPEGVEDEVEGQIVVDLNKYQHLFPDEEYLIAPIPDYNIGKKQFKEFNTPVEITIPHCIIDPDVRKNIKVYSIDGEKKPQPIGQDTTDELYYKIMEKCIIISLKHFTQFPCTTHGTQCEMEAVLRLYMASTGEQGDYTAKLSPKLLLGCATSSEFKGNVYLDPGMKLKSQKQFVLPKPHHCHSVSTEIEQSEPWKVLKGGAYVEIIEAQITPVEHILKNKMKIPKVIALAEYTLSESRVEKLSCTLYTCFQYKNGSEHKEQIQLTDNFSTQAAAEERPHKRRCLTSEMQVCRQDTTHGFVHDEESLKSILSKLKPYLLEYLQIDYVLIAVLNRHEVLDIQTNQTLKNERLNNNERVDHLMTHIALDTKRRFLPLLLALEATSQTGVIEEMETEGIKRCLNLENNESSLLVNLRVLKQVMENKDMTLQPSTSSSMT